MRTVKWTKSDIKFLLDNYNELSNYELSQKLKRTETAIKSKLSKLLKVMKIKPRKKFSRKNFSEKEFLLAISQSCSHGEARIKLGYQYGIRGAGKSQGRYASFVNKLKPDISHFSLNSRSAENKDGDTIEALYNLYKSRANKKGLEFNLDLDTFITFTSNNCFYCNSFGDSLLGNKQEKRYCGIDRKDSNIGYVLDNVVSCCKKCNLMKNAYSINEFLAQICKIYQFSMKDQYNVKN